jgi:hypothetical protein
MSVLGGDHPTLAFRRDDFPMPPIDQPHISGVLRDDAAQFEIGEDPPRIGKVLLARGVVRGIQEIGLALDQFDHIILVTK